MQGTVVLGSLSYALIDPSYNKDEWSFQDEQLMVEYHNELGNKWAIIGSKLGGRYDYANSALTIASKTTFTLY